MKTKLNYSDLIDGAIANSIKNYDGSYLPCPNPFEELLSMGELVDRLSIVNFKLYTFKEEAMNHSNSKCTEFEDIKLCLERARLKKCIDEKLINIIRGVTQGNVSFNQEIKKYGK